MTAVLRFAHPPRRLFPAGFSIDRIIRPIPPSPTPNGDGAETSAAASGPVFPTGVCELPGAAAVLSSRDRTRMAEALDRVIDQRHRQLDFGHTVDTDMSRDERVLLGKADRAMRYTYEDMTLRAGGLDWRSAAITHAANSAALLLAFIEVMLERQAQEALEPEPAPIEQGELGL